MIAQHSSNSALPTPYKNNDLIMLTMPLLTKIDNDEITDV